TRPAARTRGAGWCRRRAESPAHGSPFPGSAQSTPAAAPRSDRSWPQLPSLDHREQPIVGQIHVQRRDGEDSRLAGSKIGAALRLPRDTPSADPEILAPAGVLRAGDRISVDPPPESRDPHPLHLVWIDRRKIHVQESLGWKAVPLEHLAQET